MGRGTATVNVFRQLLKRLPEQKSLEEATKEVVARPRTQKLYAAENVVGDIADPNAPAPAAVAEDATVPALGDDVPEGTSLDPADVTVKGTVSAGPVFDKTQTDDILQQMGKEVEDGDIWTNLNTARIETEEDVIGLASAAMKHRAAAGGGLLPGKSFEGVREAAKDVPWEQVVEKWRQGIPLNEAELRRAREADLSLLESLHERAREIQKLADEGKLTDEIEYEFRLAMTKTAAVHELVANEKRRLGQSLAMLKDTVAANPAIRNLQRDNYLERFRTGDFKTVIKQISAQNDATGVAKTVFTTNRQRVQRWLGNAWYNVVLSTFAVPKAFLGGAILNKAMFPMEKLAAAAVSSLRLAFKGGQIPNKIAERVTYGEVLMEFGGFFGAFKDAAPAIMRHLEDPNYTITRTKFDRPQQESFRTLQERFGKDVNEKWKSPQQVAGNVALMVMDGITQNGSRRLMQMSDYTVRSMAFSQRVKALGYRVAANEGLEGDDLVKRVNQLLDEMPEEFYEEGLEAGNISTLTQKLWLPMQKVENAIQGVPGLRFFAPFTRTMMAMAQAGMERNPITMFASPNVRAAFAAGGAQRDEAIGKAMVGSMLFGLGAWGAHEGWATSGASLPKETQSSLMLSGWRPNSLAGEDAWVSMQFSSPAQELFFAGVAAAETAKYMNDGIPVGDPRYRSWGEVIAATSAMSIFMFVNMSLGKSVGRGVRELLQAVEDPGRFARQKAIDTLSPVVVPVALTKTARTMDPTRRRVPEGTFLEELMDNAKKRLPGLSDDLPPAVGFFGELNPEYSLLDVFSWSPADPNHKLFMEIYKNGVNLRMPDVSFALPGGVAINLDTEVTPDKFHPSVHELAKKQGNDESDKRGYAYYVYSRLRGNIVRAVLEKTINDPNYKRIPAGEATYTGREGSVDSMGVTQGEVLRMAMNSANAMSRVVMLGLLEGQPLPPQTWEILGDELSTQIINTLRQEKPIREEVMERHRTYVPRTSTFQLRPLESNGVDF